MMWSRWGQRREQEHKREAEREQVESLTIIGTELSGSSRGQIGRFSTVVQGDQHIHQYRVSLYRGCAISLTRDRNEADILSHLPRAARAAYNSSSSDDADVTPTCLAETRVAVLKEIKAWVYGKDERCIFWLNGVAGMGKSTIARTICHEFSQKGHLGASFFFSRDEQDRSHVGLFFTTIGWQLSHSRGPVIKKALVEAVRARPDIAELRRKEQWESLVLQPLKQQRGGVVVIVIDALDECIRDNEVRNLISLLVSAASVKQCRLRIMITSRPEAVLRTSFADPAILHRPLELHNVADEVVDGDICLYLYSELNRAKEQHECSIAAWPDADTVNQLVARSNRLFIYAATLCKFVLEYRHDTPDRAVELLLSKEEDPRSSQQGTRKTARLDKLYREILKDAVEDRNSKRINRILCKKIMRVLSYITTLRDLLSSPTLANIIVSIRAEEMRHLLKHTHSILRISKDSSVPVKLYHPSFREFLHDQERCGSDFLVDSAETNQELSEKLLDIMCGQYGLRRDCLSKKTPGILRSEVRDDEVAEKIGASLAYACCHWVHHFVSSSPSLEDGSPVHVFLQTHILHWIEALSWLGRLSESISQIGMLLSVTKVSLPFSLLMRLSNKYSINVC